MGMDDTILEILLPLQDEEEEKMGRQEWLLTKCSPATF